MSSNVSGYEYDIFISYRHKDNKRDGWVTEFVNTLKDELDATIKEPISIYFDNNPHDGLLETDDVDRSLEKKLKCLIFIPIISQTYCDPKSFAWRHELLPFVDLASNDKLGMNIILNNGNVANRILPIRIHDIDSEDATLFESATGGHMRPIDFVYKTKGVNRPLKPIIDNVNTNEYHTVYRDQINKVANGVKQLIKAMVNPAKKIPGNIEGNEEYSGVQSHKALSFWQLVRRRNIPRATFFYVITAWLTFQLTELLINYFRWQVWVEQVLIGLLLVGLPIAIILAWRYEKSPTGFIRTNSKASAENPFTSVQKKPPASYAIMAIMVILSSILSFYSSKKNSTQAIKSGEVSIAIVPFRNNTGDENHKHFGLGFANAVRNELSLSKQFEFISALEATIKYWNQYVAPQQIAKELGVHYLLTGMYETAGEKIKVSVELIDASSGKGMWNFVFNDYLNDIFEIESNIAQMVLDEFELENNSEETNKSTNNIQAYSHYLKGLEIHNQDNETKTQWKAFDHFTEAVKLDSGYKEAWIGLVESKSQIAFNSRIINMEYSLSLAQEVKEVVDEFDIRFPNSNESNLVHGVYHYHGLRELDEGLNYFQKVLEHDPENFDAHKYLGFIYIRKLNAEQALQHLSKAIDLKPNEGRLWLAVGQVFKTRGDYKLAIKALKNAKYLGNDTESVERMIHRLMGMPYPEDSLNNPHQFWILTYYYNRDFESIINLYDTADSSIEEEYFWKTWAYLYQNKIDSAKKYVLKLDSTNPTNKAYQYAIFKEERAVDYYTQEISSFLGNKKDDLSVLYGHYINIVEINVMLGQYEEATNAIIKLNMEYPEYDNYNYFKTDPGFDKIKEEYPPFVTALKNLKPPPPIEVDEIIKF
ncbi:MAG: hypothetical protein OEW67_00460 [Cyclobacteriaceae bacterium]|nr:hypothetical protein [Cyclobacteriaceae bacterium]